MERRRSVSVRGRGSSVIPGLKLTSHSERFPRGPRILIVEDHHDTRKMYAEYLRYMGSEVITAQHGRSALKKARKFKPAAIVLDLIIPGLDGWDVLSELKGDERTAHIPVIIVTGHDLRYYLKNAALAAGADIYLQKPCLPEELARQVRRALDRRDPAA